MSGGCLALACCAGAQAAPLRVQLDAQQGTAAARTCGVGDSTVRLLAALKQKVVIDAYVTRGQPRLDGFVRDLEALLQGYKSAGGGKLDYTLIEAKDDEAKKKTAAADGLVTLPFGEASDGGPKADAPRGYLGLVFHYGADKDVIPFLSPELSQGLELLITNKLRDLRDKGDHLEHRIGVLVGHDELKLSEANLVATERGTPSVLDVIRLNFPMYALVDVDLQAGERAVDDGLEGLIITQPGKDLGDKELRRIDEYVMKGKSLAVFASSVNVKPSDATMSATLSAHGLDRLLGGYGIELRKDVVLDFGSGFKIAVATQGGIASVRFPQIIDVTSGLVDASLAPFFRLDEVVFPFASSLVLHKDRQPRATTMAVAARSSPQSIRRTDDTLDLAPFQLWRPKGEWEQFNLAAIVEGRLTTAFPGDAGAEVPAGKLARIFVVASSQFTANPFARAGNGPDTGQLHGMMPRGGDEKLLQIAAPYADLSGGAAPILHCMLTLKNTLDWMVNEPALSALAGREACGGFGGK